MGKFSTGLIFSRVVESATEMVAASFAGAALTAATKVTGPQH